MERMADGEKEKQTDERLEQVGDSEHVARLLKPCFVEGGVVSHTAFSLRNLPNGPETYISVLRLVFSPSGDVKELCGEMNWTPTGHVLLPVKAVRDTHIRCGEDTLTAGVRPYPTNNPPHAGIIVRRNDKRIKGQCEIPAFMQFKRRLLEIGEVCIW